MCEGDVGLTAATPQGPSWGGMVTGVHVFICGPGVGWCVRMYARMRVSVYGGHVHVHVCVHVYGHLWACVWGGAHTCL